MADKIPVEAMDSSKLNSPVSGPVSEEATVMMDQAKNVCHWNGREFSDGQVVVCDGVGYECSYGQWVQES